jgi:glucosamine--fructose-6-phosphate aminotransferase (isomerizing)
MCGIFGIIVNPKSEITNKESLELIKSLFILSESRGKESAGIAIKNNAEAKIEILKKSIPASRLIKSEEYKKFTESALDSSFGVNGIISSPFSLIAHARLVTNGSQENNNNNQPVIKSGAVGIHNGIITNVDSVWQQFSYLQREYEVDSEALFALIQNRLSSSKSIIDSVQYAFSHIKGSASIAVLLSQYGKMILATNNGSLYYSYNTDKGILLFASEKNILSTAISETKADIRFNLGVVKWMQSFTGLIADTDISISTFSTNQTGEHMMSEEIHPAYRLINHAEDKPVNLEETKKQLNILKESPLRKLLQFNQAEINKLRRCTKCLLPETFPFIRYDTSGICNYCHSYIPKMAHPQKEAELKEKLKKYIRPNGEVNCIVPFSGGRDSSYGLHYIVKELHLKPITFTYDWGMVTDLARRNIARLCGKLGVENIIVSADIATKRNNIRLNVEAWLKKPELGMIPLFMAGDKHFFHYVNVIKKQTGVALDIWMGNSLEDTNFKVGFAGQSPEFDKKRVDSLSLVKQLGLGFYYLKNFIQNPAYINKSLFDTAWAFYSYYAEPRTDFYMLFDFVPWDEQKIEKVLFEEYEWEVSPDTTTTWRIGDGTAAFYNYIYYTVAGFSEFDTFRSNQIREGLITREKGLQLIEQENRPRFESMLWYLETIGVDFERAVNIINKMPKLYTE